MAGPKEEVVLGMIERGGDTYLKHLPNTHNKTIIKELDRHLSQTSRIVTDKNKFYLSYFRKKQMVHSHINHSQGYVVADIHTQNIEAMWSNLQRGIYGVYRHVSKQYLQQYINEYGWRFNHRKNPEMMFDLLLNSI